MSIVVKHCDSLLAKYHGHVSPLILSVAAVITFGFVSPTLLYAAEVTSSASSFTPAPEEFRPERARYDFRTSSPIGGPTSTILQKMERERMENKGVFSTTTQAKLVEYRNARIQKMLTALVALEKSSAELRAELEKIQSSSPSSTQAINMGMVQKKMNEIINQLKKTNFNNDLLKIKNELKAEQSKRLLEVQKREVELRREKERLRMEGSAQPVSQPVQTQ